MPLDHTNNVDASLMKKLSFGERIGFSAGIQLFNVFNHSQFVGGYLSDVSLPSTAAVSRNFLLPSSVFFGGYQQYLLQQLANGAACGAFHVLTFNLGAGTSGPFDGLTAGSSRGRLFLFRDGGRPGP